MEFQEFPKIPRLNREVVITEKIDGTNACVWVSDDSTQIGAQSRTRVIVPGADNHGFARWVYDNDEFLRTTLGPGYHYGEWWGQGIQRRYGMDRKVFSLFNSERWKGLSDYPAAQAIGLSVVPILYTGRIDDVAATVELLRLNGSVAAPGWTQPEGVIVYHTASRSYYKVLLENDDVPKGAAL